jgi:hypothetical protein
VYPQDLEETKLCDLKNQQLLTTTIPINEGVTDNNDEKRGAIGTKNKS